MKRHLLWILPVVAGLIGYMNKPVEVKTETMSVKEHAQRESSPQAERFSEVKKEAPAQAQTISAPSAPVAETWAKLDSRVKNLAREDQQSLDDLYVDAANLIHSQEKEVDAYLAHSMPKVIGGSLEQSFFTFSSWVRYSSAPAAALEHLWEYTPPADDPTADHHHDAFTQAFRYEAVQAYALSELRKRFEKDGINLSADQKAALVKSLVARAAQEKSINQSLEIFQTLLALGEKQAVIDALATRSERDRKLIAETIGLSLES